MKDIYEAIRYIIHHIGEDIDREDLKNTPERFVSALLYCFSGYRFDAALHLKKYRMKNSINDMIIFEGIKFFSHCEHHILPMVGKLYLGYIPNEYVIGVSDVMKIVEGCTRKLQLQEKITTQVAELIYYNLEARGVAVLVIATHSCVMCDSDFKMRTVKMIGEFETDYSKRQEFYSALTI